MKKIEKKSKISNFFEFSTDNRYMRKVLALIFVFISLIVSSGAPTTSLKAEEVVDVPILMYHSILKSRKGEYILSPDNLKNDLVWLKDHGYQSVFVSELIDFCEGRADLPKKPIVVTFDDGHYNNYYYAKPIFEEMGFKATINVVGTYSEFSTTSGDFDNPNYSHLTWSEIKVLQESEYFEIGNHTYNMHNFKPRYGIGKKPSEDYEAYKKSLTEDVSKLEDCFKDKCGFTTNIFAYPFGKYSEESYEILSELGFKAFLTCNEGINHLTKGDASKLKHLKRFNRSGLMTTEEFFKHAKIY